MVSHTMGSTDHIHTWIITYLSMLKVIKTKWKILNSVLILVSGTGFESSGYSEEEHEVRNSYYKTNQYIPGEVRVS